MSCHIWLCHACLPVSVSVCLFVSHTYSHRLRQIPALPNENVLPHEWAVSLTYVTCHTYITHVTYARVMWVYFCLSVCHTHAHMQAMATTPFTWWKCKKLLWECIPFGHRTGFTYICIYIYRYIYIYWCYIYLYICTDIYVYWCMFVYILCVCVYTDIYIYICVYI